MKRFLAIISISLTLGFACMGVSACSEQSISNSHVSTEASIASDSGAIPKEAILEVVEKSVAQDYQNVTFKSETTTSASTTVDGQTQTKSNLVRMNGQADKSSSKVHIAYESATSERLDRTTYDMFIGDGMLVIKQGDQMYPQQLSDEEFSNYEASVTPRLTSEEVSHMLDVAKYASIENHDDGSVSVSITLDADKVSETDFVDTSSLPENTKVSTVIAIYSFDAQNRLVEVRYISSTTGNLVYRVTQSYTYSDYDTTTMPEWPDYKQYMLEQAGIKTDESGRMYFVAEDGNTYYVDSIDDDGTVHFSMPSA